jgi:hypothetical protein
MVMTSVIVVMVVGSGRGFSFRFGFIQHFLHLAFKAFAMDRDTTVFRSSWSDTVR